MDEQEDAEEIVQEVMLWLWENRGDLITDANDIISTEEIKPRCVIYICFYF